MRIGPRTKSAMDPLALQALEAGTTESRTHIEQMCMTMSRLLRAAYPDLVFDAEAVDATPFIERFRLVGNLLYRHGATSTPNAEYCWVSDTVRGWMAMAVAANDTLSLEEVLFGLRPFAVDHHFAVREWAWLAARPSVASQPEHAFELLRSAAVGSSALERRFAIELTRPRSVWGQHIPRVKVHPEMGEQLLDRVMCDESDYVARAVSNWITDAARSAPGWAHDFTSRWATQCDCGRTRRILSRVDQRLRSGSSRVAFPSVPPT
jgi:3-methyladenine DNA glycosylase AlkC